MNVRNKLECLMFVFEARKLPKGGARDKCLLVWAPALLTNIRPGREGLSGTNTLALEHSYIQQ